MPPHMTTFNLKYLPKLWLIRDPPQEQLGKARGLFDSLGRGFPPPRFSICVPHSPRLVPRCGEEAMVNRAVFEECETSLLLISLQRSRDVPQLITSLRTGTL